MSNNTEVIFENIEKRILKEIESAHYAIFVSVAWFTNKQLFNALLDKAKSNCYVSIIIQLDEINSQSGIDYTQINVGRSECFMISKDAELLHEKFCVIDFKKVITGSYNWTYKASHNSENILVLNDPSIATQYISRFEQQKAKFNDSSVQDKTLSSNVTKSIGTNKLNNSGATQPKTVKCYSCKEVIGFNDNFCFHCGREQKSNKIERSLKCPSCYLRQDEPFLDAYTYYCTNCGNQIREKVKSCPVCNRKYSDTDKFCTSCGTPRWVHSGFKWSDEAPSPNPLQGARPEQYNLSQYQQCGKCNAPNLFGVNYCRSCGEEITTHAKDQNGHGWIDLGLSVLWSTESINDYFFWSNSEPYDENSRFRTKSHSEDIATVKWGEKWRTPTKDEFEELIRKCKWEKCVIGIFNDHALKVTGPNGNSIILRTTGVKGLSLDYCESKYTHCCFWTSSKHPSIENRAYAFWYEGYTRISKIDSSFALLGYSYFEKDPQRIKERKRKAEEIEKRNEEIEKHNMATDKDNWLQTPVVMTLDNTEHKNPFRSLRNNMGLYIRPVADKKWQGKL